MKTNIIQEELFELRIYSEKFEAKQKEFMSNKKLLNLKTGEIEDLTFIIGKASWQTWYNYNSLNISNEDSEGIFSIARYKFGKHYFELNHKYFFQKLQI